MCRIISALCFFFLICCETVIAQHETHISEYSGQEYREIKSLSEDDIDQLKTGKGWGLAKAAELNGVPGPSHILEMSSEIELSETQQKTIQSIFDEMQEQAIVTGKQLIEKEKELNSAFATKEITPIKLEKLTSQLGVIRGKLTFIHLEAHLKAGEILSDEQIKKYNELRGYDLIEDACGEVPEGHDPEMWKKHNNCNN